MNKYKSTFAQLAHSIFYPYNRLMGWNGNIWVNLFIGKFQIILIPSFSFHGVGNRWVRFGNDLELLDSPGIIPMRMSDQSAAIKLAICDDIGERSYNFTDVAGVLVQMLSKLPTASKYDPFALVL